jgi:small subunit ribosomal protein S21
LYFLWQVQFSFLYLPSLKRGGDDTMLIIPVKDGENIDRALKRFKRKFDKTGTMRQLRDRQQFTKPSVKRRKQVQKAQYIQHLRDQEEI